jgi:hypothetical protein
MDAKEGVFRVSVPKPPWRGRRPRVREDDRDGGRQRRSPECVHRSRQTRLDPKKIDALVGVSGSLKKATVPAAAWSTLRIVAKGNLSETYMNGQKLFEARAHAHDRGAVLSQVSGTMRPCVQRSGRKRSIAS